MSARQNETGARGWLRMEDAGVQVESVVILTVQFVAVNQVRVTGVGTLRSPGVRAFEGPFEALLDPYGDITVSVPGWMTRGPIVGGRIEFPTTK